MKCLLLLFKEDAEASVFVIRELVLLDADDTSNFGELGFVPVQGRDVDGRDLDREVFVGGLELGFLVLSSDVGGVVSRSGLILLCGASAWLW